MLVSIFVISCILNLAAGIVISPHDPLSFVGKIKHVIVLMLENRSFDHMLGFLKKLNDDVNGCLPGLEGCSNHIDPLDGSSPTVTVDDTAVYQQVSPHHSIHGTTQQIYGYPDNIAPPVDAPPTMDGFIASYNEADNAADIMKCFSPDHVPVITSLAQEFGMFDGWFASVPGPTMVNRAYAGSATSNGMGTNDDVTIAKGMPQKSMYRQLIEMGLDYKVYFSDVPSVLMFKDMRHKEARGKFNLIKQFNIDVAAGNIPEFVWLEPGYFNTANQAASDQHPDHDVSIGEQLIKDTYEAIRASPIWNETAFIITYDEHGGFFDHVAPPQTNVPNPDGKNSTDDPFDFTRLGVRIPTVVVSPWVKQGSVFHGPTDDTSGQFDHTSILATVIHKLFKPVAPRPNPEYLTKRDAWAKTFEWVFDDLVAPRTDCLVKLPEIMSHKESFPDSLPVLDGSLLVTDLQMELIQMVSGLIPQKNWRSTLGNISQWTEAMGFDYCSAKVKEFLLSID